MSSRYYDSEQAWQVSVDSQGHMSELQPHAQACGTTVSVAELFCNTPARRRFLRAARTEFLHVQDVVMRAALSRFDIGFSLNHNGREVLRLPAINDDSMRERRLAGVGGKSFQQALQPVCEVRDGVRVHGWLAPAEAHRAQADRQFVFINGRMVRDKVLNHAIRQAYGNALPPGRYAMYALYIELDASRVDVNVHPTKHEVRFREVRPVHDVIFSVVQHGLRTKQRHPQQTALAQTVTTVREPATVYALNAHAGVSNSAHVTPLQTTRQHISSLLPGGYALVVRGDDYWLYNLQRLAQAVFSDRLQRQQADRGVISRPLLIPQRVAVGEQAADWLDGVGDVLSSLGVDITRSSNASVLLRGLPEAFTQLDATQFVTGLVEQPQIDVAALIDCAVNSLAELSDNDAQQLLASLNEEQQAQCRRQLTANDLHDLYKG
jgi:DNA mismatch repair protein MutL